MEALVVGQVARDLVLTVDRVPGPHDTTPVRSRREMLGGKGANQGVALSQLGISTGLCGVVGDDDTADSLLEQAHSSGLDTGHVVRRAGTRSALIVDLVTPDGQWRYLEDIPGPVLLTEADVTQAAGALSAARAVFIQLQQPSPAALAAGRIADRAGALVVLDGAPADDPRREPILATADVIRADEREGSALTGVRLAGVDDAVAAGRRLLAYGPRLVALAVPDVGNVFVWPGGQVCLPLLATHVVDTTGAGDAFIAGLAAALLRGQPPVVAAKHATAAASASVGHPGGRPDLSPDAIRPYLARLEHLG
jgi:ribokinase